MKIDMFVFVLWGLALLNILSAVYFPSQTSSLRYFAAGFVSAAAIARMLG